MDFGMDEGTVLEGLGSAGGAVGRSGDSRLRGNDVGGEGSRDAGGMVAGSSRDSGFRRNDMEAKGAVTQGAWSLVRLEIPAFAGMTWRGREP